MHLRGRQALERVGVELSPPCTAVVLQLEIWEVQQQCVTRTAVKKQVAPHVTAKSGSTHSTLPRKPHSHMWSLCVPCTADNLKPRRSEMP